MQMMFSAEEHKGYTCFRPITGLDAENLEKAEGKFREYKKKGIIVEGNFGDDGWILSDEVKRRRLDFSMRLASEWTGCTYRGYQSYVKAYVVLLLGEAALTTLAEISKSLLALGTAGFEEACRWDIHINHAIRFLSMIPDEQGYREAVAEYIEENRTLDQWRSEPRQLAGFRYYLRFDKWMKDFWNRAEVGEKDFYFPIHLWWNLTSVLPLRATEFLLLPADCLKKEKGRYILTVRRTRLKKGAGRIGYAIEKDYERKDYEIPEWLAAEIDVYQKNAENHKPHEKDTLFAPNRFVPSGYLTYAQMRSRLLKFCTEVMGSQEYPIHLGDTRHLAMINLILSGGSPVICRELAGHESIGISSNYYANLSTVVESVVYEKYFEQKGDISMDGFPEIRLYRPKDAVRVEGGHCDATGIAAGDISECMKNFSKSGHFGDCINCIHYYPDEDGLRITIDKGLKDSVDEDGFFLMQMIEQVRKGNGAQEDIAQALLRLQNSSTRYNKALCQKYEGGIGNGKTEKK